MGPEAEIEQTGGHMDNMEPEPTWNQARPSPRQVNAAAPLRLSAFDWSGFVAQHFSLTLAGGTLATGVGLGLIDPAQWPNWILLAVPLSPLSLGLALALLVFAFVRVWKTVREEHETSALWEALADEVSPHGTGMDKVKDAVFEIPYLFSILILPFLVVSFQAFALCLVAFYACDNYYNLALVRKIGTNHCARLPEWMSAVGAFGHRVRRAAGDPVRRLSGGRWSGSAEPAFALLGAAVATGCSVVDPAPASIDRVALIRFFGRRARLDTIAIWLLLGAFAGVTALASLDRRDWALAVGLAAMLALLALEVVVEPFRALGIQYQPSGNDAAGVHSDRLLWAVPPGASLDARSLAVLEEIHQAAFPPPERQYGVDDMVSRTGRGGFLMLILTEREQASDAHAVAGYVFVEARPARDVAFFWYLAIDQHRRGRGLGHRLVELAVEVVHDRWPSVRAIFLETASPARGEAEDSPSDEMRRIRFYRDIGFRWVRSIAYEIPAAHDPQASLRYDPMFLPAPEKADDITCQDVAEGVREMARDNFPSRRSGFLAGREPVDRRWTKLIESTDELCRRSRGPADEAANTIW